MCIEIGTEFHCLGGEDNNSNSYRNRARIPLFGSIISGNQCYKNKARIPVFGRIRSEFEFFLKKKGQNFNIWKDKIRAAILKG